MSRGSMEMFESTQKQLIKRLLCDPVLEQRLERLMSIDGVGPITALTWALEVADPHRFSSVANAVSYCGLTAAFRSSAGKQQRGPISKQRNAWLQTALIEAAKLAPRWNPQLAALHAQQRERGHAIGATLQVARKLVAYLLAVDKNGQPFRCALRLRGQKQSQKEKTASSSGVSRLGEKIRPVRGCWSFLRHADLSPDGHSQLVNAKGNPPKKIPLVTHRLDESGRVSLAGCSPAEPASVSSTHSGYQSSYVQSVSDPPAGPRVFCGCARGLRLPIHLTVCFEAGRFTLTQSSWTASARRCSRKWMSGHAGKAVVLISGRGQSKTRNLCSRGEPVSPGQRESPFPLDHYLSWMPQNEFCPATPMCNP